MILLLLSTAHAVTCDEVLSMLAVDVPVTIVAQTMERSERVYTEDDVRCLERGKAPAAVLDVARSIRADAEPPPPIPAPAPIPEALRPIEAQLTADPLAAASRIHATLASAPPSWAPHLHRQLGDALLALDLPLSAEEHYRTALGDGSPAFSQAAVGAAMVARQTGSDALLETLTGFDPAALPPEARDDIRFVAGKQAYQSGDRDIALALLKDFPENAPRYPAAMAVLGVAYYESDRLKSAVKAFREIVRTEDGYESPLSQLALINIARVYYSIERYDNARSYYEMKETIQRRWRPRRPRYVSVLMHEGAPYRDQVLIELAWVQFMLNELDMMQLTLADLGSEDTPAYAPEANYLRSIDAFKRGWCVQAEEIAERSIASLIPLRDLLQVSASVEPAALWAASLTEAGVLRADSPLPEPVLRHLLQSAGVSDVHAMGAAEEERLRDLPADLGFAVGSSLAAARQYHRLADAAHLAAAMQREAEHLTALIERLETVRFESLYEQSSAGGMCDSG